MKKLIPLSISMLMASASLFAQSTEQEVWGSRIDYLNDAGQRVGSYYPYRGVQFFQASSLQPDGGYLVYGQTHARPFSSINIVPHDVYSYPVEVSAESAEVTFSISILTDTNGDGKIDKDDIVFTSPRSGVMTRSETQNKEVKNGDLILFTMDIPVGTTPQLSYTELYTQKKPDGSFYYYNVNVPLVSLINSPGYFPSFTYYWQSNPDKRDKAWYEGGGDFVKDPDVAGRWYIIFSMPNEPLDVKLSYVELDSSWLLHAMGSAAREVYVSRDYGNTRPFFNGEPWTMMQCGDALSQDAYSPMGLSGNSMFISPEFFANASYWMPQTPWLYYVGMIDMTNYYLSQLDSFKASDSEKARAEGVMRILRANSYLRLMQLFGARWEDSNDGAVPVAPILTEWGNLELPAASMREIRDFCKSDLEFAIATLGDTAFDNKIIPDADVARGLLVRLSMLCHDWNTAAQQSAVLVEKFPLTTNSQLKAGFFTPVDSWIWTAPEADYYSDGLLLGYNSFQASAAVNGSYPLFWNCGNQLGCIDRSLFLSIPEGDVRRELFVMPETLKASFIKEDNFFSSAYVDPSNMAFASGSQLNNFALAMLDDNRPAGVDMNIADSQTGKFLISHFGTQFKFWGSKTGMYSNNDNVCLMRADEFLLSRAEALYELGDQTGAIACLTELNSMRIPGYKCSATGDALREEIRLTRRIELWGEGHSFFDFKRWNIPMERKAWKQNDLTSGNWPESVARSYKTSDLNGWRYLVPRCAFQSNPNLDINSYGYTILDGYEAPTNEVAPALLPVAPAMAKPVVSVKAELTRLRKR